MSESVPKSRAKELRQEAVLCRIKYHNNLPELPFDPKFLSYPFDSSRFVQYAPTSLERNHKHELLCETSVGVSVDLIDPDAFKISRNCSFSFFLHISLVNLHPDDERLVNESESNELSERKSRHRRSVAWLRKTEYLSTEHYNKFNKSVKIETKLGHNIKQRFAEEIVYRDKDSQVKAIEKTFAAAKKPIINHYSKKDVKAVEVLPILPDFMLWKYPCAQVIFDDDPSRSSNQPEDVTQAVIRGMVDNMGDHFVVYFLPTAETKEQRRRDAENHVAYSEDVTYEYEKAREYNWNVKNKTMANYEESYFFVFREATEEHPAGVYYNELETRVRLSKRRKLQSSFNGPQPAGKVRLVVKHREANYYESQAQMERLEMLKHESELDEPEDEGGAGSGEGKSEKSDQEHEAGSGDEDMHESSSAGNSRESSPAPSTSRRHSSGRRQSESEQDVGHGHSSLSEDEESEKSLPQTRRQLTTPSAPSKHHSIANVFSSSDDDDMDARSHHHQTDPRRNPATVVAPAQRLSQRRQSPESSDLSNDSSPEPNRYASDRNNRKRPSTQDLENSESGSGSNRSLSPPPRSRRRQDTIRTSAPRRTMLSESDLSSLSD
nr:RNA polymerase II associated factor 1 [Hymenolepis microstoma]